MYQRDSYNHQNRNNKRHEIKNRRHLAEGRAQLLGARLGLSDELVGERLGWELEQGLHLHATVYIALLSSWLAYVSVMISS